MRAAKKIEASWKRKRGRPPRASAGVAFVTCAEAIQPLSQEDRQRVLAAMALLFTDGEVTRKAVRS